MNGQAKPDIQKTDDQSIANQSMLHQPAAPLNSAEFEVLHYGIAKGEFQQTQKRRNDIKIAKNPHLFLVERVNANTDMFLNYLKRVGENYGWHLRKEFQDAANRPYLDAMMKEKTTHLYMFKQQMDGQNELGEDNAKTIGFCLLTSVPAIQHAASTLNNNINSINPVDAVERAKISLRQASDARAIEISKIGLLPEYTNKGLGHIFLAQVLDQIFEVKKDISIAYLNTRTTNHRGIDHFYTENGFQMFHSEKIKNDLVIEQNNRPPTPPAPPEA